MTSPTPPPPSPPTSSSPSLPNPVPPSRPTRDSAPQRLEPSDFGRRKEAVANEHEDHVNEANIVTDELDDIAEFILDSAHIADSTVTIDMDLPDAPCLREALAGPKQEQWN